MSSKVKGVWLIVECEHCLKPQTIFKLVWDNHVDNILKIRHFNCEYCGENCFVELENKRISV